MSQSQTFSGGLTGRDPPLENLVGANNDDVVVVQVERVEIEEKDEEQVKSLAEVLFADERKEEEENDCQENRKS